MGCEVEIEFAVHLEQEIERSTFYFLQIRPMASGGETADVTICDHEVEQAFGYVSQCLGHGVFGDISDILFVCPDCFDSAKTKDMAAEIGEMNRKLVAEDRPYLLIGPGRWGTADPWLGIPVAWSDISGVAAIIELRNETLRADPSQGTHFFQNITSLGIPYLTLTENSGKVVGRREDFIDWQWLRSQPLLEEGKYIHHVRLMRPFTLKCDGVRTESVLFQLNTPCGELCTVEGKEVWDQRAISQGEC